MRCEWKETKHRPARRGQRARKKAIHVRALTQAEGRSSETGLGLEMARREGKTSPQAACLLETLLFPSSHNAHATHPHFVTIHRQVRGATRGLRCLVQASKFLGEARENGGSMGHWGTPSLRCTYATTPPQSRHQRMCTALLSPFFQLARLLCLVLHAPFSNASPPSLPPPAHPPSHPPGARFTTARFTTTTRAKHGGKRGACRQHVDLGGRLGGHHLPQGGT